MKCQKGLSCHLLFYIVAIHIAILGCGQHSFFIYPRVPAGEVQDRDSVSRAVAQAIESRDRGQLRGVKKTSNPGAAAGLRAPTAVFCGAQQGTGPTKCFAVQPRMHLVGSSRG